MNRIYISNKTPNGSKYAYARPKSIILNDNTLKDITSMQRDIVLSLALDSKIKTINLELIDQELPIPNFMQLFIGMFVVDDEAIEFLTSNMQSQPKFIQTNHNNLSLFIPPEVDFLDYEKSNLEFDHTKNKYVTKGENMYLPFKNELIIKRSKMKNHDLAITYKPTVVLVCNDKFKSNILNSKLTGFYIEHIKTS